jgi:pteridine reductase
MTETLSEKVALVTGSGKRRVGHAIATALAARGYAVALHYHRSADEARQSLSALRALGVRAEAFQADVADEPAVARMFQEMMQTFGRLDVLVTAAAVWDRRGLEETTAADVRRAFDVNALGTFLCCQQAGRIMADQPEGGAIVTIGDWACARPYGNYAAYFLSKGTIPTLTRALAVELAQRNRAVRVNCILPGPVMRPEDLSEADVKGAVAGTLLKRLGRPENIAQAVVFLVENDYVTGVCLPVDGGRTIAP